MNIVTMESTVKIINLNYDDLHIAIHDHNVHAPYLYDDIEEIPLRIIILNVMKSLMKIVT